MTVFGWGSDERRGWRNRCHDGMGDDGFAPLDLQGMVLQCFGDI
jgi:hypothetical protein